MDSPPILRPLPRRPFQLTSDSSNESSNVGTPQHLEALAQQQQEEGAEGKEDEGRDGDMKSSQSILNLTASTLSGIYAPTGFDAASQPQTPWGTGAETPIHRNSLNGYPSVRGGFRESELQERLLRDSLRTSGLGRGRDEPLSPVSPMNAEVRQRPRSTASSALRILLRVVILYGCGLAYGSLVAHLHDNRRVSPVQMDGLNREGWRYLAFWGMASVVLGLMLPWVDSFGIEERSTPPVRGKISAAVPPPGLNAVEWNDVVRSVGAFIGVAFAIRKTPWSSPLQLAATLAMVNPFLWYLLDRTSAGFLLSTASGFLGIIGVLVLNPSWVPSPSHSLLKQANTTLYGHLHQHGVPEVLGNVLTHERVGSAIWIGSVFFCSCICFGNIGRLLATAQSRQRR